MDCIIVRTKLESIIISKLINEQIIKKKYILIELYQNSKDEDDESVYKYYAKLSKNAFLKFQVVELEGAAIGIIKYATAVILTQITNGKILLAGVTNYPLALTLKFLFFNKIYTFDNGNVNIDKSLPGSYHKDNTLEQNSLKRKVLRFFFPRGTTHYFKKKLLAHFTIFPNYQNIAPLSKNLPVNLKWSEWIEPDDLNLLKRDVKCVILGTVFSEQREELEGLRNDILRDADTYIAHPREVINFYSSKIFRPKSPVESILAKWSSRKKIKVYHFNSTAACLMENYKNIEFINIDPITLKDNKVSIKHDLNKRYEFLINKCNKFLFSSQEVERYIQHESNPYDFINTSRGFLFYYKFFLIASYGYLKLFYLYLIQKNDVNVKHFEHLILEADSKHMYQNYFNYINSNGSSINYKIIKAFNKKDFTSLRKLSFFSLSIDYKNALKELFQISNIVSEKIYKLMYKNIFHSIAIYAYWNSLFLYIKNNTSIITFSSKAQIPDCAATNKEAKIVYIAHGLIEKIIAAPSYNEVWLYTEYEKKVFKKLSPNSQINIYKNEVIPQLQKSILIFLPGDPDEVQLNSLIEMVQKFIDIGFEIHLKMHPNGIKSSFDKILFDLFEKKITQNFETNATNAINTLRPMFCAGGVSTALIESLKSGIIPICLSDPHCEYIEKTVLNFRKNTTFWKMDKEEIISAAKNNNTYSLLSSRLNMEAEAGIEPA